MQNLKRIQVRDILFHPGGQSVGVIEGLRQQNV